jgi:serine/threonine protein kinase
VEQIAETVSYMHRQGVVHGNLKPSNVLLAADDIPRLSDFRFPSGFLHGTGSAKNEQAVGHGYMAPELVENPGAEARPYTDTYGLGVILYELLAGRPLFAGGSAREVLELVSDREPDPPSLFNPKVSGDLDAFCLRCLLKNPWRRFIRAYDLLVQLRHFRGELERTSMLAKSPDKHWPQRPRPDA